MRVVRNSTMTNSTMTPEAAAPHAMRAPLPTTAPLDGAVGFPARVEAAPVEARIDETFGAIPGAIAVAALMFALSQVPVLFGERTPRGALPMALGAFGVFAVFAFMEIYRRVRRTSLVFVNGNIGIYRGGRFAQAITPREMAPYKLSILNGVRELMLFGIAFMWGGCAVFGQSGTRGVSFTGLFFSVALLLGAGVALLSTLRIRFMCKHFLVPRGRGSQQVALPTATLQRMGLVG